MAGGICRGRIAYFLFFEPDDGVQEALPVVVCLCRLFMSAAGGQDACLYQGTGIQKQEEKRRGYF